MTYTCLFSISKGLFGRGIGDIWIQIYMSFEHNMWLKQTVGSERVKS